MTWHPTILVRAIGLGVINSVLLSLIMVPAFLAGIPPMPEPPSLAFAKALFGRNVPVPAGLLFHLLYVTFWSVIWVVLDHPRLRLVTALVLGIALWLVALVVFFPINGWGFLGLAIGPALIPAALIPHVLFSVFLWGLSRLLFRDRG